MITHNSEVIIYDGSTIYSEPLKPKNLSEEPAEEIHAFPGISLKETITASNSLWLSPQRLFL